MCRPRTRMCVRLTGYVRSAPAKEKGVIRDQLIKCKLVIIVKMIVCIELITKGLPKMKSASDWFKLQSSLLHFIVLKQSVEAFLALFFQGIRITILPPIRVYYISYQNCVL